MAAVTVSIFAAAITGKKKRVEDHFAIYVTDVA